MKALFIGLGSIGQRHLVNFRKLAGKNTEIIACRTKRYNLLIENGKGKGIASLSRYLNFREINDLDKALKERPDAVFITNPTSRHMQAALKAAACGVKNIFIEKPLADNLTGVDALKSRADKKKLNITIGFQTRFHPCYKLTQRILSSAKYGRVLSASFEWGTYLPSHHPYEDYRQGYAALKSLGGGVVLGLIHEIDMIQSFWGEPKVISAVGGKLSELKMTAEDTVSALLAFKQKEKIFPVTLFLSYAQTKESRHFRIQFEKATLFCDLLKNSIEVFGKKNEVLLRRAFPRLKRNDLFLQEMKEFISSARTRGKASVTLQDGIASLRLALKIKGKIK